MSASAHVTVPTLPMLVERWGQVVAEIERGYTLTFDDYLNDMDLRHLIARSIRNVPPGAREQLEPLRDELKAIDVRFVANTEPTDECIWGQANAEDEGWSPDGEWWYYRQPMDRPEDW
jgi:hypothetical protein